MTAGDIQPVLVEGALAAFKIDKKLVEGIEKIGAGLHGGVAQGHRDLQPVAEPIRVFGFTAHRQPALLQPESMLKIGSYPHPEFEILLLITPCIIPVKVRMPILVRNAIVD